MMRDHIQRGAGWMGMALMLFLSGQCLRGAISADETVLLYPAMARPVTGGWDIQWNGAVYEPERRPVAGFAVRQLFGMAGFDLSEKEESIFTERSRLFMVDNERGKTIRVSSGRTTLRLGRSGANGRFESRRFLGSNQVQAAWFTAPHHFKLPLVIEESGGRTVTAEVHVVGERGLSVISDIDDTIKISEVRDKEALLRNTFCRPFTPVTGMAEVYQSWAVQEGAAFHYVSASPWQLYLPLSSFVRSNGFPAGTFHMKEFRLKDRTAVAILASPEEYKPDVIEPLLRQFPGRQFVLVGDSGEKDPEIYANLARKHPGQIQHIFIRDVTGEDAGAARYEQVFRGIATNHWRIFREAGEIKDALNLGKAPLPNRN